jgi:hypothetical protein
MQSIPPFNVCLLSEGLFELDVIEQLEEGNIVAQQGLNNKLEELITRTNHLANFFTEIKNGLFVSFADRVKHR